MRCESTAHQHYPAVAQAQPAQDGSGALSRKHILRAGCPAPAKTRSDGEDEAWFVCEDRQSKFYHNGTTGQTSDSPLEPREAGEAKV